MSNFSQGVTNLQNNMQNIFGGLTRRHNKSAADDDSIHLNDRQDLMEDDDEFDEKDIDSKNKPKTRRPKENAFTQQKLKAIHPILTAKEIIPLFLCLAIIFIPIGASMLKTSNDVNDFTINYAKCAEEATTDGWTTIPSEHYTHHFKSGVTLNPRWRLAKNDSYIYNDYPEERNICQVQFQVPNKMKAPVYFYYKLSNFHANHRRYVKSFSEDQLNGKRASVSTIKDTVGQNCQPLSVDDNGKIIYPCGLIANSLFNDTFDPTLHSTEQGASTKDYQMSEEGIAWSTNKNRFKKTKYDVQDIVPPPNWVKMYPQGYNETNLPDISQWPQFQNWMSPAALSDFSNLVLRNDHEDLPAGVYQVNVGLHFPTTEYNGGKYIYVTTGSSIGGRNSFLGISWIVGGAICLVLAIVMGVVVLARGRKSGDTGLLSWNREHENEHEQDAVVDPAPRP